MNDSIAATIAYTEKVLAGLRLIGEMPEAVHFHLSSTKLSTSLLQFFPHGQECPEGYREIARPFAKALGGTWRISGTKWESTNVAVAGFEDTEVVFHYIEPSKKPLGDIVDLSEPEGDDPRGDEAGNIMEDEDTRPAQRDEPNYDAPTAKQEQENMRRVYTELK